MKTDNTPFEVFVRVRPIFSTDPLKRALRIKNSDPCTDITVIDPLTSTEKTFSYNGVFSERLSNSEVYGFCLQKQLPRLLDGHNTTCFAYGSTGAGKTHTMFGYGTNIGVSLLSIQDLFKILPTASKKLSFLEIYNESVVDLLSKNKALMIVEDPIRGVFVPELSEFPINSIEEAQFLIQRGNKNRAKAPTMANEFSTRSHGVLQIQIEHKAGNDTLVSKLCLIDLAGSERACTSENRGIRMKEGANINKSLLALGNCINILSDFRKKGAYVPFRDSKLTRLLKESLGGNSKTIMIACVSPLQTAYEDTSQTLKYASRAKNITTVTTKVVKTSDYLEIIHSLKSEIEVLRTQLSKKPAFKQTPQPEPFDSKVLSQQIINNFEEHWELKQSITEIEELNKQNQKLMETADLVKKEFLKKNIFENESRKNQLLQSLYVNMKQKQILQNQISEVEDESKREFLNLQIVVRTLKLEKIDLFVQNDKFKQEVEDAKKESSRKDQIIEKMQAEIECIKTKMSRQRSFSGICSSPTNEKSVSIGSFHRLPCHRSNFSLQQARDLKKNNNRLSKVDPDTTQFLSEYISANKTMENDEDIEEGKTNLPMPSGTRVRTTSTDEGKIKPGAFSGLQIYSRGGSAGKLKTVAKGKPKKIQISIQALAKTRKILQKKDINVMPRIDTNLKKTAIYK